MKILVFAHTPPPMHGQSVMVATLLEALRADPGCEVFHVDARLSDTEGEIGRWRIGKVGRILRCCVAAWRQRLRHGPMTFYYVPAPAKRGAFYRDLLVLALCRPFFPRLVLHWHAVGLGAWLENQAVAAERWLGRALLGRADLAIMLAPELAADAAVFQPRRAVVIPNCAPDPQSAAMAEAPAPPSEAGSRDCRVLFLGLCTRDKGVFDALEAVALANAWQRGASFRLTVAGGFPAPADEVEFRRRAGELGENVVEHVGFVTGDRKRQVWAAADVFCLPTRYAHEGQPVALLEAMAYDKPIVATRWRAIPSMIPPSHAWLVEPHTPPALADALVAARDAGSPRGAARRHFLAHFTPERHAAAITAALKSLS